MATPNRVALAADPNGASTLTALRDLLALVATGSLIGLTFGLFLRGAA